MAALLKFVLSIFIYFANFAIAKLGAVYGIRLALVTFWIAGVLALTAGINMLLSGVSTLAGTIHPAVQTALLLLPPVTGSCIAAIASCRATCWIFLSSVYVASAKAGI